MSRLTLIAVVLQILSLVGKDQPLLFGPATNRDAQRNIEVPSPIGHPGRAGSREALPASGTALCFGAQAPEKGQQYGPRKESKARAEQAHLGLDSKGTPPPPEKDCNQSRYEAATAPGRLGAPRPHSSNKKTPEGAANAIAAASCAQRGRASRVLANDRELGPLSTGAWPRGFNLRFPVSLPWERANMGDHGSPQPEAGCAPLAANGPGPLQGIGQGTPRLEEGIATLRADAAKAEARRAVASDIYGRDTDDPRISRGAKASRPSAGRNHWPIGEDLATATAGSELRRAEHRTDGNQIGSSRQEDQITDSKRAVVFSLRPGITPAMNAHAFAAGVFIS